MSVDNLRSCGSSNQDVAGHITAERPKLLESIGWTAVSLTHYILRKSRHLPCLVGPVISAVEDIVSPCIQPLATRVEDESMYLLSLADKKLYAVGEIALGKVPLVSVLVSNSKGVRNFFGQAATAASSAYEQVCGRGMIGAAADTWVKYEVTVKSKSAKSLNFVKRIPLLNVFVPVIYTVGTPIASAISSWLAKHSAVEDKHLVLHEVHPLHDDMDLKDVAEEKHLFVADNGGEDSTSFDTAEIDIADNNSTAESSEGSTHPETVKKADLLEEVGEVKTVSDEASGEAESDISVVAPVSHADEDSDDELSVLFDAGWSLGVKSPSRRILAEPRGSSNRWW